MNINVKKLHEDAVIPTYATAGSAGFDLYALEETTVDPGETKLVRTGLAFDIPEGYEVQIRPRSGLSLKTKLRIPNSPATIDSDYTDEVQVIMENVSFDLSMNTRYGTTPNEDGTFTAHLDDMRVTPNARETIEKHQRIAQGVLKPVPKATFTEVEEIAPTERTGGFGSTGN